MQMLLSILSHISKEYDKTNDYKVYCGLIPTLIRFYMFSIANFQIELSNNSKHKYTDKETFQFTLKRGLILLFLFIFVPIIIIWNHIGYFLDDIFYPKWHIQTIKNPLFIIGNARSGTTYYHRLLSYNNKAFTTMKTWEILFASSIIWKNFFYYLYSLDLYYFNGFITYQIIMRYDNYLFGNIKIHPIGLFEPEEDEWLLIHIFSSQLYLLFNPLGLLINENYSKLNNIIIYDKLDINLILPKRIRLFILQFYKNCIKKHLYYYNLKNLNNKNIIYLSKNPPFTMRLDCLYQLFPNGKFICLIRNPKDSIPSMVSYISYVWKVFSNPNQLYPNSNNLISFCELHYTYPIEFVENSKIPKNQWLFLSYHHLMKHLYKSIISSLIHLYDKDIYKEVYNEEFEKVIKQEEILNKSYQSNHHYSIEECCHMNENELKQLIPKVYECHSKLF